tara:strand:+ start:767 stop:1231 length:465 start_codon:yes stop_codon:yes gene_type:complete
MTFDERTKTIGQWVQKLLRRYEAPSRMDNDSLREELMLIVKDVNSNIAGHVTPPQLSSLLERIEGKIRASHGPRTWPTIKTFIDAAKKSAVDAPPNPTGAFSLDPLKITEKRIKNKEAISDIYITSRSMKAELLSKTSITQEDLDSYELVLLKR